MTFTAEEGQTVEVVLTNKKAKGNNTLTVMKQVYSGEYQVYAQDTAAGTYAQEGCYTYYAALYADAKRTKKVSDVKEITVNGLSGHGCIWQAGKRHLLSGRDRSVRKCS